MVHFSDRKNVQQACVFLEKRCISSLRWPMLMSISRTAMLEIASREAARKRGLHADSRLQAEGQPAPTTPRSMKPSAPRSLSATSALRLWMDGRGVEPERLAGLCAQLGQRRIPLPPASTRWPARRRQTGPGKPLPASTKTAARRSRARRATPASRKITARSNTRPRAGSWNQTASASPSPMGTASARCV